MAVVTLTLNPAIDKSCEVERVIPEHKLRCSAPQYEPGGGGINVSRAMLELGASSLACWSCGGSNGELLGQLLDEAGLEHRPIVVDEMVRENLTVLEESTHRQYRFGMPGPTLREAEAQRWLEFVEKLDPAPDYVVLSGSLPPGLSDDFYGQIIERLARSCRVIVDTSGEPLRRAVAAGVFLIKPNLRELSLLAGRELEDDRQIEEAVRQLIEQGRVEVAVTSLGSGGAIVVTPESTLQVRAPTVPIRSKVGAGDSMVGGMLTSLTRGDAVLQAARFGVAAGAAAVMTPGSALCRRADTERLYQRMLQDPAHHAPRPAPSG